MKRIASLLVLVVFLAAVVTGSFCLYACIRRDRGAVPSALLAGFTALNPRTVFYATKESEENCLKAYEFLKRNTNIHFIENISSSRYNPTDNLVYLTETAFMTDSAEAVHEFGHALDRYLHGEDAGYFSRQASFSQAYAADCSHIQNVFQIQELFETEAYRNLAISDILFAMLYEDTAATKTLAASYDAVGVPYWRHEKSYMSSLDKRQTEVFANIFTIFLSDDDEAKRFLQAYLPAGSTSLLAAVQGKAW